MTNHKKTRKALLSSVVSLLLCVTMLLGTTFAWFTDTASTSVNKIQAGTLDIQLLDADGESLEGDNLVWQKAVGHENEDVRWEPGATYKLQPVTIKNNGNLALKYKIEITGIQGDAKLNEAIEWTISVGEDNYAADTEFHLTANESETLTISGHMKESAGNEYQGLSIDHIAITVYATQDTVEQDSNGNQYDVTAEYPENLGIKWSGEAAPLTRDDNTSTSVKTLTDVTDIDAKTVKIDTPELLIAFAQSVNEGNNYFNYKVYLESDMDLCNLEWTPIGTSSHPFQGNFYGQDHTISNLKITSGSNVGLFGHITLAGDVNKPTSNEKNYTPGIQNLTLNNVTITADNSGAFVGNANTTTRNAGNGGALWLYNLSLTGNVKIEGANVGGIIGTEWTDFQIAATNITVNANEGSYVKGTGVVGGVFASTPHGTVEQITSNINVYVTGTYDSTTQKYIGCAGGIVGCAGWDMTDVTCTGNVVATDISETDNGKYQIGKIVGREANNPYWSYYKSSKNSASSQAEHGSGFARFTATNTITITLTNSTTLTDNGLTAADKRGTGNQVAYHQSLVGAAIWAWQW